MHIFNTTTHQPKGMAVVYWIHKPEHTDMFTQGYIGVTKRKALARWREHLRSKHRPELKIYLALAKYDTLVFDVIVIGTREYCQQIEVSLRPEPNIGWNTAMGGDDNCTLAGGISNKQRWAEILKNDPIKQADRWWRKEMALLKRMHKEAQRKDKQAKRDEYLKIKPLRLNRKISTRSKTGLTGATWYKPYGKWQAQIRIKGKSIALGYFDTVEEAHLHYTIAKKLLPLVIDNHLDVSSVKDMVRIKAKAVPSNAKVLH